MMYYVYLLLSLNDDFRYVGITDNLKRRFKEHNSGKTLSTASKRPYCMIVIRRCADRLEARKTERYYKSGFGRKATKKMLEKTKQTGIINVAQIVDLS